MIKTNKKVGHEIVYTITNTSYVPTKLQKTYWLSATIINAIMIIFFCVFVWAIWSVGNQSVKRNSEVNCYPGSRTADVNCILAI